MARVHSGAVLPVTAFDRANVAQLATGQLEAVDTQVNTTTGTVMLRANFENSDERLYPSQFVNVVMLLDTLKDALRVPVGAVQRGAPGSYVYLVDAENTVSVHPIKLGPQDGDFYAVESGLSPGDVVVTDGADRLRDGAKVTVPEKSPTTAAPGAAKGRPNGKWSGSGAHPGTHVGAGAGNGQRHHHQPQGDQPPGQTPSEGEPPAQPNAPGTPPESPPPQGSPPQGSPPQGSRPQGST
jgi:multidrug efflux system membrane fusion protein